VCDPGKEIGVGCVGEERGRERERGGAMADGGGLSELGVLVAQLESVVHSGSQKPLQPLMCFDLLSDLDRESKVSCAIAIDLDYNLWAR
jgi:hypothetical protein